MLAFDELEEEEITAMLELLLLTATLEEVTTTELTAAELEVAPCFVKEYEAEPLQSMVLPLITTVYVPLERVEQVELLTVN